MLRSCLFLITISVWIAQGQKVCSSTTVKYATSSVTLSTAPSQNPTLLEWIAPQLDIYCIEFEETGPSCPTVSVPILCTRTGNSTTTCERLTQFLTTPTNRLTRGALSAADSTFTLKWEGTTKPPQCFPRTVTIHVVASRGTPREPSLAVWIILLIVVGGALLLLGFYMIASGYKKLQKIDTVGERAIAGPKTPTVLGPSMKFTDGRMDEDNRLAEARPGDPNYTPREGGDAPVWGADGLPVGGRSPGPGGKPNWLDKSFGRGQPPQPGEGMYDAGGIVQPDGTVIPMPGMEGGGQLGSPGRPGFGGFRTPGTAGGKVPPGWFGGKMVPGGGIGSNGKTRLPERPVFGFAPTGGRPGGAGTPGAYQGGIMGQPPKTFWERLTGFYKSPSNPQGTPGGGGMSFIGPNGQMSYGRAGGPGGMGGPPGTTQYVGPNGQIITTRIQYDANGVPVNVPASPGRMYGPGGSSGGPLGRYGIVQGGPEARAFATVPGPDGLPIPLQQQDSFDRSQGLVGSPGTSFMGRAPGGAGGSVYATPGQGADAGNGGEMFSPRRAGKALICVDCNVRLGLPSTEPFCSVTGKRHM